MPIYDYQCTKCNHKEELIVAFKDIKKPQHCTQCHKVTRLLPTAGKIQIPPNHRAYIKNR